MSALIRDPGRFGRRSSPLTEGSLRGKKNLLLERGVGDDSSDFLPAEGQRAGRRLLAEVSRLRDSRKCARLGVIGPVEGPVVLMLLLGRQRVAPLLLPRQTRRRAR